jgi:16S rRNA (adenine(1408)-N(1))-methyltransferase
METIRGRKSLELDFTGLKKRLAGYDPIMIDLGTGDGRYVHYQAKKNPGWFVIGIDSCSENLYEYSRAKLHNMLFIIASAQELPCELNGLVSHISINFPWGSLLDSLFTGDLKLMRGLASLSLPAASVDVRLNGGALAEAGWAVEAGTEQIFNNLKEAGWQVKTPVMMDAAALRAFPSTWAKRLAFGRDPRAMVLSGPFSGPLQWLERHAECGS